MPLDPDKYDFFVSYARADNRDGWISRFVEELLAEHRKFTGGREPTYFFDTHDIRNFDDWQLRIYDSLSASRLFLAFISPSYFASEWCRREWRTWIDLEIAKHILSGGAAPVYFVEVPGFVAKVPGLEEQAMLGEHEVARKVAELCGVPPSDGEVLGDTARVVRQMRDRRQIVSQFVEPFRNQGIDALRQEDLRRVLAELARDLDQRAERVRQAAESRSTVPPYNKRFSGRLDELLQLREKLKDDQAGVICGVHGLGGIGKTELAFTYAHAFAGIYPGGRFLVPCEGKTRLRDAALALGDQFRDQINDEERMAPDAYFAAIRRCLSERLDTLGHILLVLDNVTDLAVVSPHQTDQLTSLGPRLHLLATTRKLPPSGGGWLTLGELPEVDALDVLEKHRPFANAAEREAARRIVEKLRGFALAVELVAAGLVAHPSATYTGVAEGLELEDLDRLAEDQDVELRRHNHERRLAAVLKPTLDGLEPPELRTLQYAALLPPDHVPLPWLRELATADFPELAEPGQWGDPWEELCERLLRVALFTRVEEETTSRRLVRVHRLVQDLVRGELPEPELTARQEAVNDLVDRRDAALKTTSEWQDAQWEIEPLDALANLWADNEHAKAAWLLNEVGQRRNHLAQWSAAEPLMRRSLTIAEESYGAEHANVGACLNNLAEMLRATNRLAEAEPPYRRALAINEESYGPGHPNVATCLSNLAQLLQATNRLAEAEPLYRRALAINEESYGPEHPDVATALNNLAQLLQATNRLAEAEPLNRRALAIDEESYGPEHPEVARDLSNLAGLLRATDRLAEAEVPYRRALAIVEGSYGPQHPRVATHLNNLVHWLQARNRLAEAEPLMRRALAIDEESYGAEHPEVARDLNNLAQLLQATNRLAEAEPLMRRTLAIWKQSFGEDHPNVATSLNNLSRLLEATNRLAEAEPLMVRHLEIFLKFTVATGHSHPHLRDAVNNYGRLLKAMGRSDAEVRQELSGLLAEYGLSLE